MRIDILGMETIHWVGVETRYAFASAVGGRNYLNFPIGSRSPVEEIKVKNWAELAPKEYEICKYAVDGDRLVVWGCCQLALGKAVEEGRLKRATGLKMTITSSTEELRAFLLDGGDAALFPDEEPMVLVRIK